MIRDVRLCPPLRRALTLTAMVVAGVFVFGSVSAGPSTSFSSSTVNPAVGSRVTFADTSGGNPTTWAWDFGDGGTSTAQNPAHVYRAEGTYTVKLTASNASGTASTTSSVTVTASGVLRLNAAHSFDVTLTAHDQ